MGTMAENPIVGKKFSVGSGPKPIVDKINTYFRQVHSIANAIHSLLDRFDHQQFQNYSPLDDLECCEISKSLLLGQRGDNVSSIKVAFTRLSVILKEIKIWKKFSEREAPIFLLDHVLTMRKPNKPTCMAMLGLKKKEKPWRGLVLDPKKNAQKFDEEPKPAVRKSSQTSKDVTCRLGLEFQLRLGFLQKSEGKDKHMDPTRETGSGPLYRYINRDKKPLKAIADNNSNQNSNSHRNQRTGKNSKSADGSKIQSSSQKRTLVQPSVPNRKRRKKEAE